MPTSARTAVLRHRGRHALLIAIATGIALAACSPEKLVGNAQLPPDVPDPASTHNPAGAMAAYRGAIVLFRNAVGGNANSVVPISGLMTDELRSGDLGQQGNISAPMLVDSRFMREYGGAGEDSATPYPVATLYGALQKARGQANEARGALATYMPTGSAELQGHLEALQGYTEIYLADVFCSGVPLSTLDFGKDFTYKAGSSTADVYRAAIALFDSAQALAADSDRILNFARIGKARALLAMGSYADAAAAVAGVPDGFQYALSFDASINPGATDGSTNRSFAYQDFNVDFGGTQLTMVDREGENGLPFISSGDPRSAWVDQGANQFGSERVYSTKYASDGSGVIVIASGVEARLIQAEAALQGGGAWLSILNALRTDGTFDTQPDSIDASKTDTLWHAGSGGVAGLAPLTDPESPGARLTLLFNERGFWLFLTGTRQGDLRRLVRQYALQSSQVYPTGLYPGAYNTYGTDVNAPIPGEERQSNPLFTGCQGRGP